MLSQVMDADGVAHAEPHGGAGRDPCRHCGARALSVCAALGPDEIRRLNEIAHSIRVEQHATIFEEGQPADALFNVTGGTVKLYKLLPDGRRQITGFLVTGDFIGLALNESYAYTAEAVTPTLLCRFPRRKLEALLDEFPKMQRRLFSMASNELAAAQDQMLLLGRKTAREKICSFLLSLSRRAVLQGLGPNPVHLPMGRGDIADYLGLTIETVSRTFTQLKTSGTIRIEPGSRIRIADPDGLSAIAEGS
ncbi:Crp/Fnr family transcriptional regulator [Arenibaculum pallidiluteum]|uniref:Crp/Fnr family transcriptional regulator n=1 Tax=Arenibaculum pallidiluteum TaxID=2812559 RepID=UPI001F2DFD45|nr:cyclic nucleotide-binding domain-containing protein [Arenibaculum pallidiluteum]